MSSSGLSPMLAKLKRLREWKESAITEANLDAMVADLRDHYNTDWDTTVPGEEFNREIKRIVKKHLHAKPSPDSEQAGKSVQNG